MTKSLDASVGRLLDALESRGLDENTAIVFTSDNGGLTTVPPQAPIRLATTSREGMVLRRRNSRAVNHSSSRRKLAGHVSNLQSVWIFFLRFSILPVLRRCCARIEMELA